MGNKNVSFQTEVMNRVSVDTSATVSALSKSSSTVSSSTVQLQSIIIGKDAVVYAGNISMLQVAGQSVSIYSVQNTTVDSSTLQDMQNSVAQSATNAITQTAQDLGIVLQNLSGNTNTSVNNIISSVCSQTAKTVVTSTSVSQLIGSSYASNTQSLVINGQINVNNLTMDQYMQINIVTQQLVYNTVSQAMSSSAMSGIVNNANNQLTQTNTGIAGIISSIGDAFAQPLLAGAMAAGLVLIILIVLFKFVFTKGGSSGGGKKKGAAKTAAAATATAPYAWGSGGASPLAATTTPLPGMDAGGVAAAEGGAASPTASFSSIPGWGVPPPSTYVPPPFFPDAGAFAGSAGGAAAPPPAPSMSGGGGGVGSGMYRRPAWRTRALYSPPSM